MTSPGFISFEGGEGVGKSRQARLLAAALRQQGAGVEETREPGGSPGAEAIRGLLVEAEAPAWPALSEVFLFAAARADHLAQRIEPALADGRWVVCDRFSDSTRVYQGAGRGVPRATLEAVEAICPDGRYPDLTFILDMPVARSLARTRARDSRAGRFEGEGDAFHERLRAGFQALAEEAPARCRLIDADRPVDTVAADIRAAVNARFGLSLMPPAEHAHPDDG